MIAITEKQLGHALFFSIKVEDWDHVEYLLTLNPPLATSYFIGQDRVAYTRNLLLGKVAKCIKQYGLRHKKTLQLLRVLERFAEGQAALECHLNHKNPHYFSVCQVLKHLPLDVNKDILTQQNFLLLKVIYHGATYNTEKGYKDPIWVKIQQINAYMHAKKDQVIELLKFNRHARPATGCQASRSKA